MTEEKEMSKTDYDHMIDMLINNFLTHMRLTHKSIKGFKITSDKNGKFIETVRCFADEEGKDLDLSIELNLDHDGEIQDFKMNRI